MSEKTTDSARHPMVRDAFDTMSKGRMDRREFVRIATLVGVSAGAAYTMAGMPSPAYAASMPFPEVAPDAKKGGILRVAMQVQKVEDPATFNWVEMGNQARHTLEYVAMTGPDNITRPMLAESWEASEDLKTWTFKIRSGVKWHNGDDLVPSHIVASFTRALNPALGAGGVIGLSTFSSMLKSEGTGDAAKKVLIDGAMVADDAAMTMTFNLSKPVLSVPEDLYNYPTAIVHPSFTPPFTENPIGTGPFTLVENKVGERCILKRVTELPDGSAFEYWGGDVYVDEIHYYNFDEDNQLTAFASGDVDAIYEFGIEQMELAKALDGEILAARTAQTLMCRMQVDEAPFDNKKVRQAIVKSVDNATAKNLVYPDGGDVGQNHAVAPIHPEFFALAPMQRDVEGAKALLAEAGYPDGIEITIDVGNTDGPWHQTLCEAMRDQMSDAGIRMNINVMPPSKFWEIWDKTKFGATAWTHRPLGTMVLSLAFRSGVPWNEAHYNNPSFDEALNDAEATFDVNERKAKMEGIQAMLQDDAVMLQPLFRPVYTIVSDKVNGYPAHPTQYHQFNKVWLA